MGKRVVEVYGRYLCIKEFAPDRDHFGIDCSVGSEYVVKRYRDNGKLKIKKCDSGFAVAITHKQLEQHFEAIEKFV